MDSFLAFSRKCISASAGVIPLVDQNTTDQTRLTRTSTAKRDLMLSEQCEYSTLESPIRSKTGIIQFYGIKAFGKLLFLWMLFTEAQQSTRSASIFSIDGLWRDPNPCTVIALLHPQGRKGRHRITHKSL